MEWFTRRCIVRPPAPTIYYTELHEATVIADHHTPEEYTTLVSTYLPKWIVTKKAYNNFIGDVVFKSDFS